MLMTTTPSVEGKRIVRYLGVVTGEKIFVLVCCHGMLCRQRVDFMQ